MDTRQAYNSWASQYDTNINKTRDLEAIALRSSFADKHFHNCLEIGCGTGKNTEWLLSKSDQITAADLSEEMLARAKEKINSNRVIFHQADISLPWKFVQQPFDLITFSLILEHISNLDHVFSETAKALQPYGYVYVGELHPFKQYAGSKARFETADGEQVLECFNHHISEFIQTARNHRLILTELDEYFDEEKKGIPRILKLIFKKI